MHIHGRNRLLLGALIMAFALIVPSAAFASHDLGIYKAEKQVDLNSDETAVDLSCNKGDYALDGMWRIDHADQDDDDIYITSIGRAVDVLEAYPTASPIAGNPLGHQDSYHFLFEKNAIGRAQAKVFVTCIKQKTEQSNGHSHSIPVNIVPPVANPVGNGSYTNNTICPINTFVAQTGYRIDWPSKGTGGDPIPYLGHLSTDWMNSSMRGWSWVMDLSQDPTSQVTFYASCVSKKLPAAGGERHKLVYRYDGPTTQTLAKNKVSTVRHSCEAAYKAVVAGFSFPFDTAAGRDPNPDFTSFFEPWIWYLGMDPQPKSRDFKFLNSSGISRTVQTAAICLNYRTT
jgi:hypothetical protein